MADTCRKYACLPGGGRGEMTVSSGAQENVRSQREPAIANVVFRRGTGRFDDVAYPSCADVIVVEKFLRPRFGVDDISVPLCNERELRVDAT